MSWVQILLPLPDVDKLQIIGVNLYKSTEKQSFFRVLVCRKIGGRILNVDKANVSFVEPQRFLIKLNDKKIVVLYLDKDNMFLYNRRLPIDMKKLSLILDVMKGVA